MIFYLGKDALYRFCKGGKKNFKAHLHLGTGAALEKSLFHLTHGIVQGEEGGEEYDGGDASKDYKNDRLHHS